MSLPEIMLKHLAEGRLPKRYTVKPLIEKILKNAKYTASRWATTAIDISSEIRRPLIKPAITIKSYKLTGYFGTINGIYLAKYPASLVFTVRYVNERARPVIAKVYARIAGEEKTVHVLFMPHAPYDLSLKYVITSPAYIVCYAKAESEYKYEYDHVRRTYTFGILDDRYKPVEEYPEPNCDNVVLDIAYDWKTGNYIYPPTLPQGLSFTNLSLTYVSGFLRYDDKYYKDPRVDNTIRISATIRNNVGSSITVRHWGLPLSVLYEDNRHVSQIDVPVSFPAITIPNGSSHSYSLNINIPTAFYGKVAVAHALSIYKDAYPIYYGGPLYQFEPFRLLLP